MDNTIIETVFILDEAEAFGMLNEFAMSKSVLNKNGNFSINDKIELCSVNYKHGNVKSSVSIYLMPYLRRGIYLFDVMMEGHAGQSIKQNKDAVFLGGASANIWRLNPPNNIIGYTTSGEYQEVKISEVRFRLENNSTETTFDRQNFSRIYNILPHIVETAIKLDMQKIKSFRPFYFATNG